MFYKRLWLFALEDVLMSFCLLLPSFQRNFGRFLEYAWNTALALPPEFFVARKINRRTFYIDLRFKLDVVCIVLCCYLSSPKTLCIPSTVISHVEPDGLLSWQCPSVHQPLWLIHYNPCFTRSCSSARFASFQRFIPPTKYPVMRRMRSKGTTCSS